MSKDIFVCHSLGGRGESFATGIWWLEARDAAKHPTVHETAPPHHIHQTKNYLAQYINSVILRKHDVGDKRENKN